MTGSDFDMKVVNRIKEFKGREFNPGDKSWTVPAYGNNTVWNVVRKFKFEADHETEHYMNECQLRHESFAPGAEPTLFQANQVIEATVVEENKTIEAKIEQIESVSAQAQTKVEVEQVKEEVKEIPETIETECFSQKLSLSFPVVVFRNNVNPNIKPSTRELSKCKVLIEGAEISASVVEPANQKGLYVEILRSSLPQSFLKKVNLPKSVSEFLLAIKNDTEVKAKILVISAAKKAEKLLKEAELNRQAAEYSPTGWAYVVGCDAPDSHYFVFSDDVPETLKHRILTPDSSLILKHINFTDLQDIKEKFGTLGAVAPHMMSYGGNIFSLEAFTELQKIAQSREDKIINRQKAAEQAKEIEEKRVNELAQGRTIITVECESRPHTQDLSGVILNSPAPQGGSFLVYYEVPKKTWAKMKEQGAKYYDAEFLEDMDMFEHQPGWRYSIGAIGELITAGFAVKIGKQVFITIESLLNFYQGHK